MGKIIRLRRQPGEVTVFKKRVRSKPGSESLSLSLPGEDAVSRLNNTCQRLFGKEPKYKIQEKAVTAEIYLGSDYYKASSERALSRDKSENKRNRSIAKQQAAAKLWQLLENDRMFAKYALTRGKVEARKNAQSYLRGLQELGIVITISYKFSEESGGLTGCVCTAALRSGQVVRAKALGRKRRSAKRGAAKAVREKV